MLATSPSFCLIALRREVGLIVKDFWSNPDSALKRFSYLLLGADSFTGYALNRRGNLSARGKGAQASWILVSSSGNDCRLSPRARYGSPHSARKSEIPKRPVMVLESDSDPIPKRRHLIQTLPKEFEQTIANKQTI